MRTEDEQILDEQLFDCVRVGSVSKIDTLLCLGASFDVVDEKNRKPLYWVRDIDTLKYILSKGVDVNSVVDSNGKNLLCSLCSRGLEGDFNGRLELISYLRDNGGAIETVGATNRGFGNALSEAADALDLDALKILLEKYDINIKSNHNRNLLMSVLSSYHFIYKETNGHPKAIEIANYLIDNGIDVKAVDEYGMNAIHFSYFDCDLTKKLIDKGVDVNLIDKKGNTPLSSVIDRAPFHPKEAVGVLLENGANPNLGLIDGDSILCKAIERNVDELDIIKMIDCGVDINKKNSRGDTPLLLAVGDGPVQEKVAIKLIEKGADINVANKDMFGDMKNAFSYVFFKGNDRICYMLLERGTKIFPTVFELGNEENIHKINKMKEHIAYKLKNKDKNSSEKSNVFDMIKERFLR